MKKLLATMAVAGLLFSFSSCKSKVKDADIKKSVEAVLITIPSEGALVADVKDGVATISGVVKDAATQVSIQPSLKDIKGLKSVVNNTVINPVAEAPVITADDALTKAVQDAVKDNPGVTVQVNDGVVTLSGIISKTDLPKLMQKINATRPKKVDNNLTVN